MTSFRKKKKCGIFKAVRKYMNWRYYSSSAAITVVCSYSVVCSLCMVSCILLLYAVHQKTEFRRGEYAYDSSGDCSHKKILHIYIIMGGKEKKTSEYYIYYVDAPRAHEL